MKIFPFSEWLSGRRAHGVARRWATGVTGLGIARGRVLTRRERRGSSRVSGLLTVAGRRSGDGVSVVLDDDFLLNNDGSRLVVITLVLLSEADEAADEANDDGEEDAEEKPSSDGRGSTCGNVGVA